MNKITPEHILESCHIKVTKRKMVIFYIITLIYNIGGLIFFLIKDQPILVVINVISIVWIIYALWKLYYGLKKQSIPDKV
jgi:hypothetical protein